MRENRPCGSEGGEAKSLPYPYQWCMRRHFPVIASEAKQSISRHKERMDC